MIVSFRCKKTEKVFHDEQPKGFGSDILSVGRRKLLILHAATHLNDLRVPPGNKLETLKGDRKGQYSIRINDQWRICFRFENGQAFDVEIVDYHS